MNLTIAHQLGPGFGKRLAHELPDTITLVATTPDQPWVVPAGATAMIAVPPRAEFTGVAPKRPDGWPFGLDWLQLSSAGIDEYPDWVFEVPLVTSSRGFNAPAIAEFALALMLAHEKQLPETWIKSEKDWGIRALGTLDGKTLGLLGYGAIAAQIARRAAPFGMTIIAHRRSVGEGQSGDVRFASFEAVLEAADHLISVLPLTAETRGLIDASAFARMKSGVHFMNLSRGAVVDQNALLAALERGQVAAASLDVTDPEPPVAGDPLYAHPRIRLSPHVSWSSPRSLDALGALLVDNIRRFAAGETPHNRIDRDRGY